MRTNLFRDMLDVCQLRGRDSTGVIRVGKDLEYTWAKRVGPPAFLVESREYETNIEKKEASVLIGHTRSKTVGDVSMKNAHPFDFPDAGICGVHNGTLRGHHSLDTHEYNKVDSEVLYGHMAKNGVQDTFEKVEGAYACVWWNNVEKTLNFIRNNERPLWFTWSKDLKTMFWASERWMFGTVARKMELWDGGDKGDIYVELPVHELWSFRVNPNAKGDEKLLTMSPIRKIEFKPKTHKPHSYNHHYNQQQSKLWEEEGWERVGGGRGYTRSKQTPAPASSQIAKGGEVPNPFLHDPLMARRLIQEQMDGLSLEDLNDPLPQELSGTTPTEHQNSNLSNVTFLNRSLTRSGSVPETKHLRNSRKDILSLRGKGSTPFPGSNSGAPFADTRNVLKGSRLQISHGVSHRTVAGIQYITNNVTHTEYEVTKFLDATDRTCCFCKDKVEHSHEIGEILNETTFICKTCLDEPKGSLVLPK